MYPKRNHHVGNRIARTVKNPISDPESMFHIPEYGLSGKVVYKEIERMKTNSLFPHAKYISIFKVWESKNRFKLLGTYRMTRYYGIAVLTDENILYYNEYRTKQTTLSIETITDMDKIFLDGYIIDENTRFLLSKNINGRDEPLNVYLKIVTKVKGIRVVRKDPYKTLDHLNSALGFVIKPRHKNLSPSSRTVFARYLKESGQFNFIPDELYAKMTDMSVRVFHRNVIYYTMIGILYMFHVGRPKKRITKYNIPQETPENEAQ